MIDSDALGVVNMIIFAKECPNALTDDESGSGSEDLDDSTWQMLSQDGASALQDFNMEDLNM